MIDAIAIGVFWTVAFAVLMFYYLRSYIGGVE